METAATLTLNPTIDASYAVERMVHTHKMRGEPCWVRTSDLLIKSQLLYRLS
jgi:hypothetical protein